MKESTAVVVCFIAFFVMVAVSITMEMIHDTKDLENCRTFCLTQSGSNGYWIEHTLREGEGCHCKTKQ